MKITEHLHLVADSVFTHAWDCAVYAVKGENGAVLIDCGAGRGHEKLIGNLARIGIAPADIHAVIASHCHFDNIAGLERLRAGNPDITLAAHEKDADAIENGDPGLTCTDWYFGSEMPPQKVDATLHDGDAFFAAGISFDIISAPGHTPGSIFIRAEIDGKSVLFLGDAFSPSCGRVGCDFDDWRDTLGKALDSGCDYCLPGHVMQSIGSPFSVALTPGMPKVLRKGIFDIFGNTLAKPFWDFSSFQYEHIMPMLAKAGGRLA